MWSWLKKVLLGIPSVFNSPRSRDALQTVIKIAVDAAPYIDSVWAIVSGLTPSKVDDDALATVRRKFPRLFDGSMQGKSKSQLTEEMTSIMMGAAAEMLRNKYPAISTTVARSAVQLAYLDRKEKEQE